MIGGGLCGMSAALRLHEHGLDTALVESRFCGWGASSRNAGHLTPTIAGDPQLLATVFRRRAPELVRLERRVGEVPVVPEGFALPTMPSGVPFAWLTSDFAESGVCGNPEQASEEKGRQIAELGATRLAEALERICRFEQPPGKVVFRGSQADL